MSGLARQAAEAAKRASSALAQASEEKRNEALYAMAMALREHAPEILEANAHDMIAAREKGTSAGLLDRLMLDDARVEAMALALESLAALKDPTRVVLEERTLYNDLKLTRITVPLGVVAMVYEARPNVTVDAAGICVKSGNACVLRGGSLAIRSAVALGEVLRGALSRVGLPEDCVVVIDSTDREVTDELLTLRDLVDVLIPRGGEGLIRHCIEHSLIPVIETGTGNCHIYIHESADLEKAYPIVLNAKTQRVGVCNACESVLVDKAIAQECLPRLVELLAGAGVRMHGDETVCDIAAQQDITVEPATEADWGKEYLDLEISIKTVTGLEEAIAHINHYGTKHSESIIAEDKDAAHAFVRQVDAAAVYINASTRFTDGGEFGLGAEIGISTQKLHVRGPFALEALTTYKYIIEGEGQVRA
ncbi:glutamate-5-semialdehyde dehydrogenase [Anaerotardibacter muris]|uniref:glutamate-5-semialdehyde dehydrogenase n=1 Tax=Anaerotardibacter muris TaxID=2941505 RepID=UPI00203CCD52|nr:glutamate-5-semialdehyde dehydrogenase [Anaerotardibacter muris]